MPRPPAAVVAFACVALGVAMAPHLPAAPAAAWFSVGAMAAAVAGVVRGRSCAAALALGALFFGGGWSSLRLHEFGGGTLDVVLERGLARGETRIARVEGLVASPPEAGSSGGGALRAYSFRHSSWTFDLAVTRIWTGERWAEAGGRLRVHLNEARRPEVGPGGRVEIIGTFEPTRPALNAGAPDRRLWAAQQREAGRLVVPAAALIEPRALAGPLDRLGAAPHALVGGVRGQAQRALGPAASDDSDGARLLRALVLGERDPDWRQTRDAFTRIGVAHLLAISGFHVALLGSMAAGALRLVRDPGRLEWLVVALATVLFLLVIPAQAPVVRGGAMALALVAAQAGGRRLGGLSVLSWVGVGLLLWRPLDVGSLGFQLSLGLTAGLIVLWPRMARRWRPLRLRGLRRREPTGWRWGVRWFGRRTATVFGVSVMCWLLATPIVVHHTGLVSPISVLSTLLVLPAAIIVLAGGYLALLAGALVPGAGEFLVLGPLAVAEATVAGVRWLDGLAVSSLQLPRVGATWAGVATSLLALWLWRGGRDLPLVLAALALAIWLGADLRRAGLARGTLLRLDTLAVGDGTCHLIRAGSGEAMLWDCGSRWTGVGEREIPRAVRALGAQRVRTVVVSHPDLDHFSGLLDVLEPLGVREVIVGEEYLLHAAEDPRGPEAAVLAHLEREGVALRVVSRGDEIVLGNVALRILWPPGGERPAGANDASLVAHAETPAGRLLLSGDIQDQAIHQLMELESDLRADVVELPHHGGHSPTAERFIRRLDPRIVVQSSGPSRLGDERWQRARPGRLWRTTARDGGVTTRFGPGPRIHVRPSRRR